MKSPWTSCRRSHLDAGRPLPALEAQLDPPILPADAPSDGGGDNGESGPIIHSPAGNLPGKSRPIYTREPKILFGE